MERLTTRNSEGAAVLKTPYQCDRCGEAIYRLADYGNGEPIGKLAEYEEIGTVDEFKNALLNVKTLSGMYEKLNDQEVAEYHKLAEYEELDEQGKLLKLTCAVGDRIYRVDTDKEIKNKEVEIYDIDNIVICSDGEILFKYDAYDGIICHLENITTDKPYLDYYKCFLTQEAAESALRNLEKDE